MKRGEGGKWKGKEEIRSRREVREERREEKVSEGKGERSRRKEIKRMGERKRKGKIEKEEERIRRKKGQKQGEERRNRKIAIKKSPECVWVISLGPSLNLTLLPVLT